MWGKRRCIDRITRANQLIEADCKKDARLSFVEVGSLLLDLVLLGVLLWVSATYFPVPGR